MIRLAFVTTGLAVGGAELMLARLIGRLDPAEFRAEVISITSIGPVGEKLRSAGVPVRALGLSRRIPNPLAVPRLARWLKASRPDVVQTWMYHADLVGGLAAAWAGAPAVWALHNTTLDPRSSRRTTFWTVRACARLSRRLPARIVSCSETARRLHEGLGYAAGKMVVIPNGFDSGVFKPDPAARRAVRSELGVPETAPLIGLTARFDPQKDHETFFRAAALLSARKPEAHFLLCGDGVEPETPRFRRWTAEAGLGGRVHLLGRRDDMPRLTAALDVAASSSAYGEAFSLALGEAMACGVPCAATDVGDAAYLLGGTGKIVAPRAPSALAAAWGELIDLGPEGRRRLGEAARRRVTENFSLDQAARRYEAVYREAAARKDVHDHAR